MAFKKLKLWFDKDLAEMLADKIVAVHPDFDKSKFIKLIQKSVDSLELKDRVEHFADVLYQELGEDYKSGIQILNQILGPENEAETGMFTNFYWIMPIAKYVEKYGLNDFKISMKAIEAITKRNTGEYTIRPFFESHFDATISQMTKWASHENKHVRRLSSEGIRPRLPWSSKLDVFIQDPSPIFSILEKLKDDESKYVQKSVANCLNDILKDNYDEGQKIINQWNGKNISKERKWIIKHALRNLIKAEDPWACKVVQF